MRDNAETRRCMIAKYRVRKYMYFRVQRSKIVCNIHSTRRSMSQFLKNPKIQKKSKNIIRASLHRSRVRFSDVIKLEFMAYFGPHFGQKTPPPTLDPPHVPGSHTSFPMLLLRIEAEFDLPLFHCAGQTCRWKKLVKTGTKLTHHH